MRKIMMLLALSLVFLAPSRPADAKLLFGTQETIHFLQDVEVTGPNQEKLFLGYMTRIENFGGGLYVQDAGYVLGVKGDAGKYFHMPEGDELARFQRDGFLPNPLPTYELGAFDYIMGYSLWWLLALGGGWQAFAAWRKRRKAADPVDAAPQEAMPKPAV
jgi:hypothetical protein